MLVKATEKNIVLLYNHNIRHACLILKDCISTMKYYTDDSLFLKIDIETLKFCFTSAKNKETLKIFCINKVIKLCEKMSINPL